MFSGGTSRRNTIGTDISPPYHHHYLKIRYHLQYKFGVSLDLLIEVLYELS